MNGQNFRGIRQEIFQMSFVVTDQKTPIASPVKLYAVIVLHPGGTMTRLESTVHERTSEPHREPLGIEVSLRSLRRLPEV